MATTKPKGKTGIPYGRPAAQCQSVVVQWMPKLLALPAKLKASFLTGVQHLFRLLPPSAMGASRLDQTNALFRKNLVIQVKTPLPSPASFQNPFISDL